MPSPTSTPNPQINREKREVALHLRRRSGQARLCAPHNISGNTVTRDEVIRREFRQFESSWYDGDKVKLSRDRVDRLGYFKEVEGRHPGVAGHAPTRSTSNLTVEEKPTGNFMVGGSFSQAEKFTFTASVQQANFAGSGQTVGIDLNTSKYSRTIAFSRHESVLHRRRRLARLPALPPHDPSAAGEHRSLHGAPDGGNMTFGVPFSETDTVYFGAGIERTDARDRQHQPGPVPDLRPRTAANAERHRYRHSVSIPLTVAWGRDSRDSALTPSHRPLPARQPRRSTCSATPSTTARLRTPVVPAAVHAG